jgi:hypothetical protein
MTRSVRFAGWPAALLAGIGLAGCASQADYSRVSTSPVTMACDGGKTFTVSYANGFETAIVEAGGQRLELQRVRTTLGLNPTPGALGNPDSPQFESTSPGVERGGGGPSVTTAGTTGIRYSGDNGYYLSRNQAAVLEIGDDTYSNCEVART